MTVFYDRATISGKARITPEGYFVADALVARANNVQAYHASELGLTDRAPGDVVRVFRPEAEVFAVDSLKSASRLPVTLDHPAVMVDARNWSQYAKGETGEEILRDGEFMRVPIRVTDASAVDSVAHDRQQFSLGYGANITLGDGVSPTGEPYDATMRNIRYNHLAAVKDARGGPELCITDERTTQGVLPVSVLIVDGFSVTLTDAAATGAALNKLIADRDSAVTDLNGAQATVVARDAAIVGHEATIADLTAKLADAANPAALRAATAVYARTIGDAKRLGVTVTDEMDAAAAQRAAVTLKMGDKAAAYSDEHVTVAFDTLVAALPADTAVVDTLGAVIGAPAVIGDAQAEANKAREERRLRLENAHKGAAKKEA